MDRDAIGLDILPSPFTEVVGSITDPAVVERCMKGVDAVVHAATLHKPHVAAHTREAFASTNIHGTLVLLEAAVRARVSAFGDALVPPEGAPAAWIQGVSKVAAEDPCALAHRNQGLACLILRTSRFFPEPDDDPARRDTFSDANLKANEFLYRRADIEDAARSTDRLRTARHKCAVNDTRGLMSETLAGNLRQSRTGRRWRCSEESISSGGQRHERDVGGRLRSASPRSGG